MLCFIKSHKIFSSLTPSVFKKLVNMRSYLLPILASNVVNASMTTTKTGIPLDVAWKQKIYHYAQNNVKHSAWGIAHAERDYQISMMLAKKENIKIDSDVIFAAAFLHDIGAIDPFRKNEIEHSVRSVEVIKPLLESYGFPMKKWIKVKTAILGHMYYANNTEDKEDIILHDADTLDFLGTIGIVRLFSVTERHTWAQDLSGALKTLQRFKTDLPHLFITQTAKKLARRRINEMDRFFYLLNQETFNGTAL